MLTISTSTCCNVKVLIRYVDWRSVLDGGGCVVRVLGFLEVCVYIYVLYMYCMYCICTGPKPLNTYRTIEKTPAIDVAHRDTLIASIPSPKS